MNPILKYSAILLVSSMALISCERNKDEIAGKGGNAVLKVTPQHHGKNIFDCMVYVKYNTQDKPAAYDDSAKCTTVDGNPVATFTGLKKGNYYFYGHGYDPDIAQDVNGGLPYTVAEEKEYNIYLPVTEVHK